MNLNTSHSTKTTFIDKFRTAVDLYEFCKDNVENCRCVNHLLDELCLDKNSLYQKDPSRWQRTYFLYNSSTSLSYKVLRYIYAEDEYYFREYYKSSKERELAKALELIAEAIKL